MALSVWISTYYNKCKYICRMKGGTYMKRKLPEWCVEAKIAMLRQENMSVTDLAKAI